MATSNLPKRAAIMGSCARYVALITVGIITTSLVVGWILDHRGFLIALIGTVGAHATFAASLGGHFWGAVSIGTVSLMIIAWAGCVINHTRLHHIEQRYGQEQNVKRHSQWLVLLCITGTCTWALAVAGMHPTCVSYEQLTTYQQIACTIMDLPLWLAGIFTILGAAGYIATQLDR